MINTGWVSNERTGEHRLLPVPRMSCDGHPRLVIVPLYIVYVYVHRRYIIRTIVCVWYTCTSCHNDCTTYHCDCALSMYKTRKAQKRQRDNVSDKYII